MTKNSARQLAFLILTIVLLWQVPLAAQAQPSPEAVYLIPIEGSIEPGLAEFVARILRQAEQANAAVLLEINTFGGRVDAAVEIKDLIGQMRMPVISFVRERAWSAGALITLAAPHVAMAPDSSIGAAEPRPMEEKTVSALRAEFRAAAEIHGRDPDIAEAMVDADLAIEGLVDAGKILTLSANQAHERGFADVISNDRQEVLEHFGFGGLRVVEFYPNWAETLARIVTEPTVSSLLLTIGFLGLIFEITSPGWGLPGTAGLAALALFFGGRLLAGLAGLEIIGLFVAGLVLIALEVFVVPGFGVTGILGITSFLASIFLSFGDTVTAIYSILFALTASIVGVALFWKRLTRSGFWRKLILSTREEKELGYKGPKTYTGLVGREGYTITPLRPAGTAQIDGERYDVVSEGGFVDNNSLVRVVRIEGTRIVVRELEEE